jgi:hypothetical protein
MTSPAGGVDFDRNRIGQGELIAGISGLVLLIDLWFDWYGVKFSGAGGVLQGVNIGASGNAWEIFSLIDIILFLVSLLAIGLAVLRGMNRVPDTPWPTGTIVAGAGGLAVLLILFRLIDSPIDTHGVPNIDVSRKFGIFLGLIAAAGVAYGGWRAMQESGATVGSFGAGGARGAAAAPPPTTTAAPPPTTTAAPTEPAAAPTPAAPETPPAPGTPGGPPVQPPGASSDPIPGTTAPETPPGLAGDPHEGEGGTTPAGL